MPDTLPSSARRPAPSVIEQVPCRHCHIVVTIAALGLLRTIVDAKYAAQMRLERDRARAIRAKKPGRVPSPAALEFLPNNYATGALLSEGIAAR